MKLVCEVIVPEHLTPEGMTLSDFTYRTCTGVFSPLSLKVTHRAATREETENASAFLNEWQLSLAEWERRCANDDLPERSHAASMAREMMTENPQHEKTDDAS